MLNFKDLGLSIANIKDADINFSSVILQNHYTTQKNLVTTLAKKYIAEGAIAILKILGSAELFGSSIKVVGSVSDSIWNVVMENLRTLINSPKGIFKQVFISLITFIPFILVQLVRFCTGIFGVIVKFTSYITFHERY